MFPITRKLLVGITAASVIAATSSAFAIADAGAKMRGDFSGRGLTSSSRSYNSYSAPVVIARAPASTDRRSLSVEPSQSAPANHGGCGTVQTKQPAPSTARRDPTTTRSYSVEPAPQPRYYNAPSRSRSVPLYELPKSDSRKFGGG